MARLQYSKKFLQQKALLAVIVSRHNALGAASPLLPYLAHHGWVLADDILSANDALSHHDLAQALKRDSETKTELRNLHWKPVMTHLRGCYRFLKSVHRPNNQAVGLWGAPITAGGKISYPKSFMQRVDMIEKLNAKHNTYSPGTSPLLPLLAAQQWDLADDAAQGALALLYHDQATATARQAEIEIALRNNIWKPIWARVRCIGAFLAKLFGANAKALGLWGFTVLHSGRAPRLQTTTLKPGGQKTLRALKIGGTLSNTGAVPLHLFRGKNKTPISGAIAPKGSFTITKGCSVITVKNPDTLQSGKFSVPRSQ